MISNISVFSFRSPITDIDQVSKFVHKYYIKNDIEIQEFQVYEYSYKLVHYYLSFKIQY